MRQTLAAAVVVAVLAVVASCTGNAPPGPGQSAQEEGAVTLASLGRQETVAIELRWDPEANTCKLVRRTPSEMRTESGAVVTWVFFGPCPGTTIAIRRELTRDGETFDPFDPDGEGRSLSGSMPAAAQAAGPREGASDTMQTPGPGPDSFMLLRARMKGNLEKGRLKYRILINGDEASYNQRADEGDLFVCPKWPCGGFSE